MKNKFFFSAMLVSLLAFCLCFTSCGPSAAEIAIRSAPSVEAVQGLKDKLIWLQGNVQSGGNYVLEIDEDVNGFECGVLSTCKELSYKDKSNITITLKGIGENRTIHMGTIGFFVKSGVTLILDDNITIQGSKVTVSDGGTLVMNEGSTITGNRCEGILGRGCGVTVGSDGTFIMKGGTISKNISLPEKPVVGCVNMKCDQKAAFNEPKVNNGAGVYVSGEGELFNKTFPSGTFIKTGGTITGYADDKENGNVVVGLDGNPSSNNGHAIYFDGFKDKKPKAIDTTVGPEITLHFSNGILREGRNEPKPVETTIQPDEPEPTQTQDNQP